MMSTFHMITKKKVDVWDGPDMPVVCHGNTLTTKIAFSDVVSVIAQFAFEASKSVQRLPSTASYTDR